MLARDYVDRVIRDLKADVAEAAALALAGERERTAGVLATVEHRLGELDRFREAIVARLHARDFPDGKVIERLEERTRMLEQSKASTESVLVQAKAASEASESQEQRIRTLESFMSNMKGRVAVLGAGLLVLQIIAAIVLALIKH
jgi:hypothetical protein